MHRSRLGSLNAAHALVAPYVPHVRVVMYEHNDLHEFAGLCKRAGLRQPMEASIKATREAFFSERNLRAVHLSLANLPWTVAFHVETLLRGGLINTQELLIILLEPIRDLCVHSCNAANTMRHLVQAMRQRRPGEDILGRFKDAVVATPTRLLPEGPYVIQSNRVLREYRDYKDHFLRLELRDEDRLPYRPQQDIDSELLIDTRFLDLLVNGFIFGGRHFKFLGWSSSSLSTHCFVFVHPGQYAFLDPDTIRKGLGSFIEDRSMQVLRQPAKYAARLGLSFTATDAVGVKIQYGEFERIPDLGCEEYPHTDGMGTIFPQVMEELCKLFYEQRGVWQGQVVETSVAQIRFAGRVHERLIPDNV
ncbi:hypothetical protein EIP86_000968 [Pleurotus ostreatoroseus]|nr:hypothetical protein EIP86_000968 [Pleurotus ostreatoroseus]